MKILTLVGAFLFISLGSYASSTEDSKNMRLDDIFISFIEYADNANDLLAGDGYYVLFDFIYSEIDFYEVSNGKCRGDRFMDTEKEMLIMAIQTPLLVAYNHLMTLLRNGALTQEEFDNVNQKYPDISPLSQQLALFDIETCTEKIDPDTLIGDTITFVKLNGKLSFLFGLGIELD